MSKDESELPMNLSHYTSLSGLQGIVKSKCLWASNVSFLNDKAELIHAIKASEEAIKLLLDGALDPRWGNVVSDVFKDLNGKSASDTYATCFCTDDDNLSQWRGYGGGVQGVCITFSRSRPSARFKSDDADLLKVAYTDKSTSQKLYRELIGEINDIERFNDLLGPLSASEMYSEIYSRASKCLPKFKYLGFKDEREWRYVVQRKMDASRIQFRVSSNKMVPYIEIGKGEKRLPIRSVRVGPGYDQELTAASVQQFMRVNGYRSEVMLSKIPFRL